MAFKRNTGNSVAVPGTSGYRQGVANGTVVPSNKPDVIPAERSTGRIAVPTARMDVAPGSGQDATVEDYIRRLHPEATNIRFDPNESGFGALGTYAYDLPGGGKGYTDPDVLLYQRNNGADIPGHGYGALVSAASGGSSGTDEAGQSAGATAAQKDARARISSVLAQYGLAELSDWAWQQILAGRSEAEVLQDLRQHPVFKREFPEIEARQKQNLAPLSPAEIISYRQNARQLMRAAGLPGGFYDNKDDFTKFIVGDVSLAELNDRVQQAKDATFNIPVQTRRRLEEQFGLAAGSGALASFFLDPDRAEPILVRQFNTARVGGAADRAGYNGLSNDVAAGLVDQGVSEAQAQQGFSDLARQSELFGALDRGENQITQEEQLGAAFRSNAGAQRRIEDRARRRQAVFQAGGGFSESGRGVSGLQDPSRQ